MAPLTGAARRVAVYGGSFNPPHHGHVLTATWCVCLTQAGEAATARFAKAGEAATARFDAVHVVPVFAHAFGKGLAPFETRVAMLEAALGHLGPRVVVDRIEAAIAVPGQATYTVDTLRAMIAREPDLEATLVLGADAWAERHKWREWEALERLVGGRFVVLGRAGFADPPDVTIDVHLPELSSSEARRRVAAGEPIWWMVSPDVERLIDVGALYR